MTWTKHKHAILSAVLSLITARSAWAEERAPQVICSEITACSDQVAAAQQLAKANRYDAAVKAFLAIYAEYPDPKLYFAIARSFQRIGQHEKAVTYYQRLVDSGVETEPDKLARIHKLLEEAKAAVGHSSPASAPSSLTTVAPTQESAAAPSDQEPLLNPFLNYRHPPAVATAPPTTPFVASSVAQPSQPQQTRALPVVAAPPAKTGLVPVYKRWWFWTAIGGAALGAAAVGIGVGLSSESQLPTDVQPSALDGAMIFGRSF